MHSCNIKFKQNKIRNVDFSVKSSKLNYRAKFTGFCRELIIFKNHGYSQKLNFFSETIQKYETQ